MIAILCLILAALVLVFFEVILPGGLLGLLALVCVAGATLIGFNEFGVLGGVVTLAGSLLAIATLIFIEFKFMANSRYGKGFFLKEAVSGHSNKAQGEADIIGKQGTALTRLNPSGKVAIDERSYEAYSQDGYIDSGEAVTVVDRDNFKLIITKL